VIRILSVDDHLVLRIRAQNPLKGRPGSNYSTNGHLNPISEGMLTERAVPFERVESDHRTFAQNTNVDLAKSPIKTDATATSEDDSRLLSSTFHQ
jgi:hypothetical protein